MDRGEARYLPVLLRAAELALDIQPSRRLSEVLFEWIAPKFDLDVFFYYVVNDSATGLSLWASAGIPDEMTGDFAKMEFGNSLCGASSDPKCTDIDDEPQHSGAGLPAPGAIAAIGIQAYVCHPLLAGNRLLGTLSFGSTRRSQFERGELECFRAISRYVCLAAEREAAASALLASENELRAVFDSVAVGIAHGLAETGELVNCNDEFCRIFGYGAAELRGMTFFSLLHRLDGSSARNDYEGVLCRGGARCERSELRWLRNDGTVIWVRSEVSFVQNACGRPRNYILVVEDVTAQIREREERERFFAVGAELLAIAGFDGHFKWVSPAWERTMGWNPEQLTTKPWLHYVHPDDHEMTIAEANRIFCGRDTVSFENRYRDVGGNWHWLSWKTKVNVADRLIYCGATVVTDRKRAEERLRWQAEWQRVTLASIGDAVVVTDATGCVTFLNGVALQLLQRRQREAVGRPVSDLFQIINGKTRLPVENPVTWVIRQRTAGGVEPNTFLIRPDGSEIPIDDSASPMFDAGGALIGVVLVFRDLSKRAQ